MKHELVWLRHASQYLALVPSLGGGVAAWQCDRAGAEAQRFDLWRPWDGAQADLYQLASFAMVPWSNRISHGGFEHAGRFHAMRPNRAGEPYPIHGDGWLQPWQYAQRGDDTAVMTLESNGYNGAPYHYQAEQTFRLLPGGLDQTVTVRHLGEGSLPYGLGLHPWFLRTPQTKVQASVRGVWLSGADPIPTGFSETFPESWDLNTGLNAIDPQGRLIDNGYSGWGGEASIVWPEHGMQLSMHMPNFVVDGGRDAHHCLIYRPPQGAAFCFEPITHPIDAFHSPGRPGLKVLAQGETLTLSVQWRWREASL
jgi:aldose 1-epimerase